MNGNIQAAEQPASTSSREATKSRICKFNMGLRGMNQRKRPDASGGEHRAYLEFIPGDALLSHKVTLAVPSAQEVLTAVFGMGTGVTPPLLSPRKSELDT